MFMISLSFRRRIVRGPTGWQLPYRGLADNQPLPTGHRVVSSHRAGNLRGVWPKIVLIDLALLIHDEGHHSRLSVNGRISNHREAGDHVTIDNVTVGGLGKV